MASLQTVRMKGKTYYRLVACRRINGKPTPVLLAYLGKADDIQKRLEGADEARIRSWSHGAVAALYGLARELRISEVIDRHRDIESFTVVYDKGNVSRVNQRHVDESKLHYVSALTVSSQHDLVVHANPLLAPVEIAEGESVPAYRTRREIWGADRTVVVLCSERLRQGQMAGVMQHVAMARQWLSRLADTLARDTFGRVVLMTDHHDWSTARSRTVGLSTMDLPHSPTPVSPRTSPSFPRAPPKRPFFKSSAKALPSNQRRKAELPANASL